MSSALNPYLAFAGNAREAFETYASILGGTPDLATFGDFGAPGADADKIMHGHLSTDEGYTFMGADLPPGEEYSPSTTFSVAISGDDEGLLRGYYDKLSEGGTIHMPLEKQIWGDMFGAFTDRFGVSWMINIGGSAAE